MIVRQEEESRLINTASLELVPYLRSSVLFWRISGVSLPLTPGNLLLAMRNARKNSLVIDLEICPGIERMIAEHRGIWQKKLREETSARFTQWENTLRDFQDDGFIPAAYPTLIRTRVLLTLILNESNTPDLLLENRLQGLDESLKCYINPGGFIWESQLASEFPVTEYWYLYVDLKGEK